MEHSHQHSGEPLTDSQRRLEAAALRRLLALLAPLALATVIGLVALWPHDVDSHVQSDASAWNAPGVSLVTGTITRLDPASCAGQPGSRGNAQGTQCLSATVRVDEGPDAGTSTTMTLSSAVSASKVETGQQVRMYRVPMEGQQEAAYQFYDFERTTPLVAVGVMFLVVVVAVARRRGLAAIISLGLAFLVMAKFLFPALIVGSSPTLVALVGSSAIMFIVIYLTHGLSTRTTTALIGTLFGLLLAAGLGLVVSRWAHLTGVANEDDFILVASAPHLRLTSVIVAGIIIAGLGVLNDVTVTQASAVWELAPSATSRADLYRRAMRIGRDHIASSVYTIAFATAGAGLSTLLLLSVYRMPLVDTIRTESFSEEIVRTLVGSIGLVLSVPLTTAVGTLVAWSTMRAGDFGEDDSAFRRPRREAARRS